MKRLLLLSGALFAASSSLAAQSAPFGVSLTQQGGNQNLSVPLQIILLLTLLTVLPSIFMAVTPFLRIVLVLHFLRQALGTQTAPSNQVLVALSLFLTLVVVQPTMSEVYKNSWEPMDQGKLTTQAALQEAAKPVRTFLLRFARERDIKLFLEIARRPAPAKPQDLELTVLVPAYILSELKTGFQIGAVLYMPFLVIDIVVASLTLAIGMVQLPPAMVSAPFKILLFVLVDGWNLVVGSLLKSFYGGAA